jgi:endonuclease VIII
VPEGDTIHRTARRLNTALAGRELVVADAPDPRSPLHHRASELRGRVLERAEARGKHLLAHFSGDLVLHSHLGINGRWWISTDGRLPGGRQWLRLAAGRGVAAQRGGKVLRLVTSSRARNDPGLMQLGPDPLVSGFDADEAAARLLRAGAGRQVGDAVLDQTILAGVGNAIRIEACFRARMSPWRPVDDLDADEAGALVREIQRVMRISLEHGRRPSSIYGRTRQPCPRCGGRIRSRGQGDANRTAYWCEGCQA